MARLQKKGGTIFSRSGSGGLEWADCGKMICTCTADPQRHSALDVAVLLPPSLPPPLPCFLACRPTSTTPLPDLPLSVHSYAGGCKNSLFGGVGEGASVSGRGLELAPRKSSRCSGSGHRANAHVKWRTTEARQPKGSKVD